MTSVQRRRKLAITGFTRSVAFVNSFHECESFGQFPAGHWWLSSTAQSCGLQWIYVFWKSCIRESCHPCFTSICVPQSWGFCCYSYLEIAILRCTIFLEKGPPVAAFQRLTMIMRGLSDPLASAYAHLYLARGQLLLPPDAGCLIHKITSIAFVILWSRSFVIELAGVSFVTGIQSLKTWQPWAPCDQSFHWILAWSAQ